MFYFRIMNTPVGGRIKIKIRRFVEMRGDWNFRVNIFTFKIYYIIHSSLRKESFSIFEISLLFYYRCVFPFHFVFHFLLFWSSCQFIQLVEDVYREINDEQQTYLLDYQVLLFLHTLRNNGCDGSTLYISFLLIFPFLFVSRNVLES